MEKIEIISRAEFFKRYPASQRAIRISGGGKETVIPLGDEIICDFCNKLIEGEVHIYSDSHAFCPTCGKRTAAKMCKDEDEI